MSTENKTELWLRGPVKEVPALLQPVAHALLQAREEVNNMLQGFPETKLWNKVAGMASVGFHLQHLAGVLDRLFTYAVGKALSKAQLTALGNEGKDNGENIDRLLAAFNSQVDKAIEQLIVTSEKSLTEPRDVGRAKLPSTVIGLLVHAAEHTMRHTGQLLVTVRVINPS